MAYNRMEDLVETARCSASKQKKSKSAVFFSQLYWKNIQIYISDT